MINWIELKIRIKIGGVIARLFNEILLLGVMLDSRFTFCHNVKAVYEKVNALMHKILRTVSLYGIVPGVYNTLYRVSRNYSRKILPDILYMIM